MRRTVKRKAVSVNRPIARPDESEVITCAGPPGCMMEGDEAIANAMSGCPLCSRTIMHNDGTETEYQLKPN